MGQASPPPLQFPSPCNPTLLTFLLPLPPSLPLPLSLLWALSSASLTFCSHLPSSSLPGSRHDPFPEDKPPMFPLSRVQVREVTRHHQCLALAVPLCCVCPPSPPPCAPLAPPSLVEPCPGCPLPRVPLSIYTHSQSPGQAWASVPDVTSFLWPNVTFLPGSGDYSHHPGLSWEHFSWSRRPAH